MSYQRRSGDGVLWRNDKRESESHPNLRGDLLIDCPHCQRAVEMYVSAWTKAKRDGEKFLSLSAKPKTEGRAKLDRAEPEPQAQAQFEDDGEIPF